MKTEKRVIVVTLKIEGARYELIENTFERKVHKTEPADKNNVLSTNMTFIHSF